MREKKIKQKIVLIHLYTLQEKNYMKVHMQKELHVYLSEGD